jgi:hypothetical protein
VTVDRYSQRAPSVMPLPSPAIELTYEEAANRGDPCHKAFK